MTEPRATDEQVMEWLGYSSRPDFDAAWSSLTFDEKDAYRTLAGGELRQAAADIRDEAPPVPSSDAGSGTVRLISTQQANEAIDSLFDES
jgi:hypothetical protein